MADVRLKPDPNGRNVMGAIDDSTGFIVPLYASNTTGRLKVDATVSVTINAEKVEDTAASDGATGNLVLGVRQDADTSPVSADGDYHYMVFDNAGAQKVNVKTSALPTGAATSAKQDTGNTSLASLDTKLPASPATTGKQDTGNTSLSAINTDTTTIASAVRAEDAPSADADKGIGLLAIRKATPANTSSTDGDYEYLQVSAGRLWVDASGKTLTVDPSGVTSPVSLASVPSHAVTNAGTFAVQDATLEGAIKNEDVASADAHPMMIVGAKRLDTPVANANVSTDGDYLPFITDNLGKLWTADVQVEDAASAGGERGSFILGVRNDAQSSLTSNDGDFGAFAIDAKGNLMTGGNIASDGVDAGNPVKVGFLATTANTTRVSSADRVNGIADLAGRQITNLGQVRELRSKQTTTIAASTSETTIVTAGGAGIFNDLAALIISNTSATAARVDIRDDTAGTILFSLYIPAGDVRGFTLPGFSIPQTATNKNWTATSSASITDLRILAIFEKNT